MQFKASEAPLSKKSSEPGILGPCLKDLAAGNILYFLNESIINATLSPFVSRLPNPPNPPNPSITWVAVKELRLSYYIGET